MKNYYTMFELIKMMEEGTAPKVVYYNGEQYVNEDNYTYSFTDDYKNCLFDEILYNTHDIRDLVTKKLIYSKNDILTDEERAFLNAYINLVDPGRDIDGFVKKPFSICDLGYSSGRCPYVAIITLMNGEYFDVDSKCNSLTFPDDYFKGMKINHFYSLKDLGLTEEDQDVEICEPEE